MKTLYIYSIIALISFVFFDIWWGTAKSFWSWQAVPTLISCFVLGWLLYEIYFRKKLRRIRKE